MYRTHLVRADITQQLRCRGIPHTYKGCFDTPTTQHLLDGEQLKMLTLRSGTGHGYLLALLFDVVLNVLEKSETRKELILERRK